MMGSDVRDETSEDGIPGYPYRRRFSPGTRGPETGKEYVSLYLDVLDLLEREGKHDVVLFITDPQHRFSEALNRYGGCCDRSEAAAFRSRASDLA